MGRDGVSLLSEGPLPDTGPGLTRVWCEVGISRLDPGKAGGVQEGDIPQHNTDVKDAVSPGDVGVKGGWGRRHGGGSLPE